MKNASATLPPIIEKPDDTLYTTQVCRGLACLLVTFYHGWGVVGEWYHVKPLLNPSNFGFSGVHMFFVISGLIIYYAHLRDVDNYHRIPAYLLKRLVRIYPLYWIVLFVVFDWETFTNSMKLGDFLSNAFFFSSSQPLIVNVSWTLAYELMFYVIFVAFIFKRMLGLVLFTVWFSLVGLNYHYHITNMIGLDLLNTLFMLGLVTAAVLISLRNKLDQNQRDLIGLGSLVTGTVIFVYTAWWYISLDGAKMSVWNSLPLTIGFGTGTALLLMASVSAKMEAFWKRQRFLLLIGNASYSIYLVHFKCMSYLAKTISSLDWHFWGLAGERTQIKSRILLAVMVLLSVIFGIIIHKLVEKPIIHIFRKWVFRDTYRRSE